MKRSLLAFILVIAILLTPLQAFATNSQAGSLLVVDETIEMTYYQKLGPFETNVVSPTYKPLTREDVRHIAEYLSFDSEGYIIPWDSIIIDQGEWDAINTAISKGRDFYTEMGITTPGGYIEFPLTLTAPDGRVSTLTVQLNIGGDGALTAGSPIELVANDVTHDIADGPLTWAQLCAEDMTNIRESYTYEGSISYSPIKTMESIRELQDINDAIDAGITGEFPMHGFPLDYCQYAFVEFKVTLLSSLFNVSFEPNNGETMAPYTDVPVNTAITAPAQPTKSGYNFGGWYTEQTFQTKWDFDSNLVTGDMTLFAKWIETVAPPIPLHTVSFEPNNGETITPYTNVPINTAITAPTQPSKSGYDFGGWYTEQTFQTKWDFDSDLVTGDMTLFAKWTETVAPPIPLHTVSFEPNNGKTIAPYTNIPVNTAITAPTQPLKSGYNFIGWYTDQTFQTKWDFSSDLVTGDITLFAKWTEIVTPPIPLHTVSFEPNNGKTIAAYTDVSVNTTIKAPTQPLKSGYDFAGWYTEQTFQTKWNFTSDIVTKNMTLFAKWTKAEKPDPAKPTPTLGKPSTPYRASGVRPTTTSPKTGDNNNTVLWMNLLLVSGTLLGFVIKKTKKVKQ